MVTKVRGLADADQISHAVACPMLRPSSFAPADQGNDVGLQRRFIKILVSF